jgi:hypothetical protein
MPITTAQRIQGGAQPFSSPLSLPAPVNGWNTRDELDAMDPLDAVTLDNFFPDTSGITCRKGFTDHATGLGAAAVETLAEFRSGATARLLAACDGSIYNVTSAGVVGAAIGTGYTNNRWQWTNFLSRLFLANGADTMQVYDGSTIGNATFTGVTLSTLVGMVQYQQRLFFWANNSSGFWYAQLNSISGTLQFFDLSAFCPRGANLVSAATITHDGAEGVLDYIAFVMSSGDMILYFGNDPGSASAWQMVGRYRVAPPVNIRSICSYGADAYVTTYDDHLPIQAQLSALKEGMMPPRSKISGAVQAAMIAGKNLFGWQAMYFPKGRYLIFNVPNADGTFDQHICNTSLPSKPWCRFTGMNASTWGLLGDDLFFGGAAGVVYQADTTALDSDEPISCMAQQAWNKVQTAQSKRMTAVRPIVQSTQGSYTFVVGFDYQTLNIPTPVGLDGAAITDDAGNPITDDDGDPITVGSTGINVQWHASGGFGTAFGFGMNVLSAGQTSWLRSDFRLEAGIGL